MQTSSRVPSIRNNFLYSLLMAMLSPKMKKHMRLNHYSAGNIEQRYACRRRQSQRRKLARKVG
jgi:hypothetical protein